MSHTGWMRVRPAIAATAVLLGLAAGPAAGNPPHITVGPVPSCTRSALQAGLSRGYATVDHATVGTIFGCRRGWAFAEVNTTHFTLTSVFHAHRGRWLTVRREPACTTHAVPRRIYRPACESN
jgi:hypothetical protein